MFCVHVFVDGDINSTPVMNNIPRIGDTIRISNDKYCKVTEVIWCFDEKNDIGQRVNLRLESEE